MTDADLARDVVRRAREAEAARPDGRLPTPDFASWEVWPFEPSAVVPVADVVAPEPPRHGEGGAGCSLCARRDEDCVWTDAHWRVVAPDAPTGAPVVLSLEPRAHADLADLPPDALAAMGPLLHRVDRAVSGLPGVARTHFSRWGDGAEHLHWWVFARPYGLVQARGTSLALWDDVLPPRPRDQWLADLARVRSALDA